MKNFNLLPIVQQFDLQGEILDIISFGNGHINDTFLVETSLQKYVIQRINHEVFKKPKEVMENIALVCAHQARKLESLGEAVDRQVLTLVDCKTKSANMVQENGNCWRAYLYVPDTVTFEVVKTEKQAYEAGKAFGKFQFLLSDLNPTLLHQTIPDFHNLSWRYEQLVSALHALPTQNFASSSLPTLATVETRSGTFASSSEIDFAFSRQYIATQLIDYLKDGSLPLRATHNDTKINNVLMDKQTGAGICVIDLDTVMAGSVIYDFGDLMRTSLSLSAEDEPNLEKVQIRMNIFEALAAGYLAKAGNFMTEKEKSLLVFGGKMITLIMGVRFLTDYLSGNIYYKTKYATHNLDRCRTQFRLVEEIEKKEEEMNGIIAGISLKKWVV